MSDFFKGIGLIIVALGIVIATAFFGLGMDSYFKPAYRALDNRVFKESEQYNDGMVRDLENLQLEYINADKEHKDAIRAIVLHRFSVYDETRLPPNLRNFYNDLRAGK